MPTGRARLREELIAAARADDDVVGAALVGSVAAGREDDWSDIDLVLQVARDVDPATVAARWTERLYERGAVDHLDVIAGGVLYRVFLLASSLQVDLSFWPEDTFRGTEPGFELLFGTPQPATAPNDPETGHLIGMGWLYALHARSWRSSPTRSPGTIQPWRPAWPPRCASWQPFPSTDPRPAHSRTYRTAALPHLPHLPHRERWLSRPEAPLPPRERAFAILRSVGRSR